MRYISVLGVAALTLAFSVSATPVSAQVPSGSYQQTCRDVGVRGSTLYAKCNDGKGNWQDTQLQDFQRCSGEIQNLYGSLQCSTGGNGYGRDDHGRDADHDRDRDRDHDGDRDRDRYPRGSYSQTCQNIQVNGDTLQASCQKGNGKYRNTSLHNYQQCRGDIQNINGKLRCTR